MKKIFYYVTFFIFIFFSVQMNTFAAGKKIGVCTYKPTTVSKSVPSLSGLSLKVTLYTDGTTKATMSMDGWKKSNDELRTGINVGDTFYLSLPNNQTFSKSGGYYQNYKQIKSCPQIQFIADTNTSQLRLILGDQTIDGDGYPTDVIRPKMTEVNSQSGEQLDESKDACVFNGRRIKVLSDAVGNDRINVRFYKLGSKNYYEIKSESNLLALNAEVTKMTSYRDITFQVNPSDIDKFMASPCQISLYTRCVNGDSKNIVLQTTEPKAEENCSYAPGTAEHDNGTPSTDLDVDVNIDDFTNKQSCEGIFGGVDGDGNFEKESFGWLLQTLLNYIKIAGPILVILLSMFEFIKAIATADDESMKKAQSRLVIRIIAVVALFMLPFIVGELLKLINGLSNPTCFFK